MSELCGGRTWARTKDPLIKSQLLYQLSYASTSPVNSTEGSVGLTCEKGATSSAISALQCPSQNFFLKAGAVSVVAFNRHQYAEAEHDVQHGGAAVGNHRQWDADDRGHTHNHQ